MSTGYVYCACRDCMEIAIGTPASWRKPKPDGTLCLECEDADCEPGDSECRVELDGAR